MKGQVGYIVKVTRSSGTDLIGKRGEVGKQPSIAKTKGGGGQNTGVANTNKSYGGKPTVGIHECMDPAFAWVDKLQKYSVEGLLLA